MSYASFSVVFGEQPSAAKWNILGTNDASFNDGTGISALTIGATTAVKNSYKFSVIQSGAQNTTGSAWVKLAFDAKEFDTGTNVDVVTNRRFTAPINGFYQFNARAGVDTNPSTFMAIAFYKNGTEFVRGAQMSGNGNATDSVVSAFLQLVATDYIEVFILATNSVAISVSSAAEKPRFSGFLVSAT